MSKAVITILFLVILLALVIYLISWAPGFFKGKGGSFSLSSPSGRNSNSTLRNSSPRASSVSGGNYVAYSSSSASSGTSANAIPDSAIPPGFSRAQLSSYFGQVKISATPSYFGTNLQVRLYSYLSVAQRINITGWRIQSNRWGTVIPQAVDLYDYAGLTPETDIIISGNPSINIYAGQSAIGKNLRLNKCTGYLENSNHFTPSLPQNCPAPFSRNQVVNLFGYCQSYLFSLGVCQLPSDTFINSLPATNEGYVCQQFLRTVNAKSCWDRYGGDSDFLSNNWVLWVGSVGLDPQHDLVRLFDKQGLLVDQNVY